MSSLQVIVNADDLGVNEQVNDAIFSLLARRRITSATVMANGARVRDALGMLKRFPDCSFGVHLNLTQFVPVSGGPSARLLVNEQGQLSRDIERAIPSIEWLRAVYEELCAQVEVVAAAGVPISHFDSHHHIHTRPQIFPALKALQRRFRMRRIRIAKNLYSPDEPCTSRLLLAKKLAYNWALRAVYRTCTTDRFTELLSFHRYYSPKVSSFRTIELMTHPGASYASDEVKLLLSDWFDSQTSSLQLISYRQLCQVMTIPTNASIRLDGGH